MSLNPNPTDLDQNQILQRSFDQLNDALRVEVNAPIVNGAVEVSISADMDNIQITDPNTGNSLHINADGSINADIVGPITIGTVNQGDPNTAPNAWPTYLTVGGVAIDPRDRNWTLNSSIDSVNIGNFPSIFGVTQSTSPWVVSGTVTAKIEDSSGNSLTSTAGALNVNVAAGSSDVNLNGLTNFQTSQYVVGTSVVQLTPTPMSNRSSVSIKVTTTTPSDAVYIGNSNSVTSSTGYVLYNGDTVQLDLTPAQAIWSIGTNPGQIIYVLEIGD